MSTKIIIFFVILVCAIAGMTAYAYFSYEKPAQETSMQSHNVSLAFFDAKGNYIQSGFIVALNSKTNEYTSVPIETVDKGYITFTMPINSSFHIYNKNSEGKDAYFYTEDFSRDTFGQLPQNIRADIALSQGGNCTLESGNKLNDNSIQMDIVCKGQVRYPMVCLRWSSHIITAKLNTPLASLGQVPSRLSSKVDKCYQFYSNLTDSAVSLPVEIQALPSINQEDYIDFFLLSGDILPYKGTTVSYETENKTSIFPDVPHRIRSG